MRKAQSEQYADYNAGCVYDAANDSAIAIGATMIFITKTKLVCALRLATIAVGLALIPSATLAQVNTELSDCAQARDPVRCLARADAIATCANLHGTPKRDCLLTNLPPPDCKAAPNPDRCQLEQDAKESCKSLQGAVLRNCLKDHGIEPPKKGKAKTKHKASAKIKKRSTTLH